MNREDLSRLEDAILIQQWEKMVSGSEADDLKLLLAELRTQWLTREAIMRDLANATTNGMSITDELEIRVYLMRLKDMTLTELKAEAIVRYRQWIDDTHRMRQVTRECLDEDFGYAGI